MPNLLILSVVTGKLLYVSFCIECVFLCFLYQCIMTSLFQFSYSMITCTCVWEESVLAIITECGSDGNVWQSYGNQHRSIHWRGSRDVSQGEPVVQEE